MIAVLTGTAFIGGELLLSGCTSAGADATGFTEANLNFLDEVGETILPATATPGAKAAHVSRFMQTIVTDCYNPAARSVFLDGIKKIDEASNKKYNQPFLSITSIQREELLTETDREARDWQQTKKGQEADHYFTMMKQLTLLGYFTSEIGCKQAQRYVPVPGRYEGNIDYHPGDRAQVDR